MQNYYFYTMPDEAVQARTIEETIKRFGNKHRRRLSGWEDLGGGGYRVYYATRDNQYVYYVEEARE